MATVATQLNSGTGFSSGETVTASKLNNLVNTATVTGIVNADIDSGAAIAKSKLASLDVVNADVNASAAIAYSKLNLANSIVNADIASPAAAIIFKIRITHLQPGDRVVEKYARQAVA